MTNFKRNIVESAGDLHFCTGQRAGCKAAVHVLSDSNAILLVDADNRINQINRKAMLHNIWIICPIIATYNINSHSPEARLFTSEGKETSSAEGTTQGNPIAMPIDALGSLPLLNATTTTDSTKHAAYADDISFVGKLRNILT